MSHLGAQRRERELDNMLRFTRKEQLMYRRVLIFLSALGKKGEEKGCTVDLDDGDLHRLFPIFARAMGWRSKEYRVSSNGKCPASSLYLNEGSEEEKSKFSITSPWLSYSFAPWRIDEAPDQERLLEAALKVYKVWLPSWEW